MELSYMVFVIPVFFLLIGIELYAQKRKNKLHFRINDSVTNLNIGIGNQVFGLFTKLFILMIYDYAYHHFALFNLPINVWIVILCFILFDFIFYWAHRWGHQVNIFWGAHVVHHQSEEYNLTVALRQPWFHSLLAFYLFLPLPILGIHPLVFLPVAGFHTLYQFWIHTRSMGKLPKPFEWILNTPSHHRVHHGRNPKYIDRNHGGVLIIWDRLFGTFQEEQEEPVYGITKPLASWNPFWANLHYYVELIQTAARMNTWRDKLYMMFAKPGWLPKYLGGYQTPPDVDRQNYEKFDTKINFNQNIYVISQFILIAAGLMAYIGYFADTSWFYRIVFAGIIILSTMICGAIFENKKWVVYAEHLRLVLVMLSLNTFYYFWYSGWFWVTLAISLVLFIVFNFWFTISWTLKMFNGRKAMLSS